ncbi:MAG: putative zinc-binding protein [Firmicutes bacterium]|nr:putative zinc-binding protein [Bacillota bacterium]
MDIRVMIIPCSGIGKPIGTVTREATYEVIENLQPEKTDTVCLALLVSGDDATLKKVKDNPCIALDGCAKECAAKNIKLAGGKVETELRVLNVMKECRGMTPETVLDIGEGGSKLVDEIARRVSAEVDRIFAERGLNK